MKKATKRRKASAAKAHHWRLSPWPAPSVMVEDAPEFISDDWFTREGTFLRSLVHGARHTFGGRVVDLRNAAWELYYRAPKGKRGPGLEAVTARDMWEVYRRTKGQFFVLDVRLPGQRYTGPVFIADTPWRFAGCPDPGERPTWKPRWWPGDGPRDQPGGCLEYIEPELAKVLKKIEASKAPGVVIREVARHAEGSSRSEARAVAQ